jgi:hypothetical protein
MNVQMKPHPILAHWVPGFFRSITVLLRHYSWSYHRLMEYMPPSQTKSFIVGLAVVVFSWIAGQGLDAARDILEHVLDLACPVNWEFFFWADPAAIENFEEHFFLYYVFCFNTAIALAGMLALWLVRGGFTMKEIEGITFLFAFFAVDTYLLRMEIYRVLEEWGNRPHKGNQKPA